MLRTTAAACLLAAAIQCAAQPAMQPLPSAPAGDSMVFRCAECGVVNSVRESQQPRQGGATPSSDSPLPSDAPVGLVLYIPFGRGASDTASYAGAVGNREWQQKVNSTSYEFTVRMDDGDFRTVRKVGASDLRVGDRVRVRDGRLERYGR